METIRNYLEAMFANMPNTPEVKKAKSELGAMMEDRYNELISEGKTENEAVGEVISSFGNLDELAEELGIGKEVQDEKEYTKENPRRNVSLEEICEYIEDRKRRTLQLAIGVLCCIICVVPEIFLENTQYEEDLGVLLMFALIAIGVGFILVSAIRPTSLSYIRETPCKIDMNTVEYLKEERTKFSSFYTLAFTIGIICCAICWLPAATLSNVNLMVEIGGAALFLMIGIGVLLIIYSNSIYRLYGKLLTINDVNTISGSYIENEKLEYKSKTAESVLQVFWPTITCIYLIYSFITFDWQISWIIWPVASIVYRVLKINLTK